MEIDDFAAWLLQEIEKRGWSQRELIRRAGISPGALSQVLHTGKGAGPSFCLSISRALNVPPEIIFRKAGLLPDVSEDQQLIREVTDYFKALSLEEQQRFLVQLRAIYNEEQQRKDRAYEEAKARQRSKK